MWLADDTPRFIYLQLDGDGPYGDPYQVNSDNNGPYGDTITRELIPFVDIFPTWTAAVLFVTRSRK